MLDLCDENQGHCYHKNTTWRHRSTVSFKLCKARNSSWACSQQLSSLNKLQTDSIGYNFGSVQIKSVESVDDLADPNRDKQSALASNAVLEAIQHEKQLVSPLRNVNCLKLIPRMNMLKC